MTWSPTSTKSAGSNLPDYISSPSVANTPPYQADVEPGGQFVHVEEERGEVLKERGEVLKDLGEKNAKLIDYESAQTKIEDQLARGAVVLNQLNQPKTEAPLQRHKFCYHKDLNDDVEDFFRYVPGGYHPVLLGDTLGPNTRYKVVHKLGHGNFSTVWLCYDNEHKVWRAIKIVCADSSFENCPEIFVMTLLNSMGCDALLKTHIGAPLDFFWTGGPNGRHLCLVLPLLGPRICSEDNSIIRPRDQVNRFRRDDISIRKNICFQITQGLQFLHDRGISHGDLRPQNILLQYNGIDKLSELELNDLIPSPTPIPWSSHDTSQDGCMHGSTPMYLVPPMDQSCFERFLVPRIAIVDFGLVYNSIDGSPSFGLPCDFAAPEILFWGPKRAIGVSTDIWALACTICTIMSGGCFFSEYVDTAISELELFLGPLPEPYRSDWQERWYTILQQWGLTPPSQENVEEFWNQSPLPGQDQALLTISNHSVTALKKQWGSETGYSDAVRSVLARTSYFFHSPKGHPEKRATQGEHPSHQITVYPIPIEPERQLEPGETRKRWIDGDGDTVEAVRLPHHEIIPLSHLVYRMLKYNPAERIKTAAILQHEWSVGRATSENPNPEDVVERGPVLKRMYPAEDEIVPPPAPKLRRSARIAARMKVLASRKRK